MLPDVAVYANYVAACLTAGRLTRTSTGDCARPEEAQRGVCLLPRTESVHAWVKEALLENLSGFTCTPVIIVPTKGRRREGS